MSGSGDVCSDSSSCGDGSGDINVGIVKGTAVVRTRRIAKRKTEAMENFISMD